MLCYQRLVLRHSHRFRCLTMDCDRALSFRIKLFQCLVDLFQRTLPVLNLVKEYGAVFCVTSSDLCAESDDDGVDDIRAFDKCMLIPKQMVVLDISACPGASVPRCHKTLTVVASRFKPLCYQCLRRQILLPEQDEECQLNLLHEDVESMMRRNESLAVIQMWIALHDEPIQGSIWRCILEQNKLWAGKVVYAGVDCHPMWYPGSDDALWMRFELRGMKKMDRLHNTDMIVSDSIAFETFILSWNGRMRFADFPDGTFQVNHIIHLANLVSCYGQMDDGGGVLRDGNLSRSTEFDDGKGVYVDSAFPHYIFKSGDDEWALLECRVRPNFTRCSSGIAGRYCVQAVDVEISALLCLYESLPPYFRV